MDDKKTLINAAVCYEFGKPLKIEKIFLAPPSEFEIQVKLVACAICHSDISSINGIWGGKLPAVYGHEASGVVSKIGKKITDVALGDRVLVSLIKACGNCESCNNNKPTSCLHAYDEEPTPLSCTNQTEITKGMKTAAFAEQVTVSREQCVKLPDDIPLDEAALISCGVITGYGAVTNTAKLKKNQTAVIIGAGGVGLNTIQAAALRGAKKVIVVDTNTKKLKIAKLFGATDTILDSDGSIVKKVKALTGGYGCQFVFVTVGAPHAFTYAPELLRAGGAVILVGLPSNETRIPYDAVTMACMNQAILGSRMGQAVLSRDVKKIIKLWRKKKIKIKELISNRFPLNKINEAMEETKSGNSNRNIIIF